MTGITGILLAAGSARRFGAAKLLQPLHDGRPVAAVTAQTLAQVLPDTWAVVKSGDHALIEVFTALGLHIIENPRADEGMGTSLAAGVSASVDSNTDGWLITLADMPWIQATTISALASRLQNGASIVAPRYQGRRGHPVGFCSRWFQPLSELRGDKGARNLIAENPDSVDFVTTADAGILRDIDYPDDLYR